jgi:glycosyltransferase involved in cell wall biosynthesis
MMPKLVRTSTVPVSLDVLLKGQLEFLARYYNVVAISAPGKELESVKKREGVTVHSIPFKRQISVVSDIIALIELFVFLRKERPQIIHSITPKAGLISMLAAKMAGVPIRMHTFTGLIFPSKKRWLRHLLILMDRVLCLASTHVYPEGQGVKRDLLNYKITSKPLKVLANGNVNGIDLDYFSCSQVSAHQKEQLKKQLGILPEDFVFVFVGRLVGDKGINELAHAFSQLENLNSKLLLVGPYESELDPLKPETLKLIVTNSDIISVGFQADVRPYFAISDCLVFPSYREGFPNVVMQAGAMELPSIVSDINGCNEIIIEGENGSIIPVKNVKVIMEAMQRMYADNDYYNHLRKNARPLIQSRFEQKMVWEELVQEYNRLLSNV